MVWSETAAQSQQIEKEKRMITQLLRRRIASDTRIVVLVQTACFAAAGLIPALSLHKLAELDLSRPELLLGVLATLLSALFYTTLGMLLRPPSKAARNSMT